MSKKKEDLEAITDLLYEWCVEYGEPYIDVWVRHEQGCDLVNGFLDRESPDYDKIRIYKKIRNPSCGNSQGIKVTTNYLTPSL